MAGVLIPTFINVVNKANRASDLSLVRNLNEALTLDSVENGKHETMYDALQAAQASGFDVAKISKKAKSNEILWDSKNDVFCYLNGTNIEYYPNSVKDDQQVQASEYYKLWKIDNNVPTNKQDQIYSIYLYGLENNLITSDITLHGIGLDVGENKVATDDTTTKITYLDDYSNDNSRHRDVVIRTDWGNLVINAEHDSVYNYNEVNQLTVTAIKSASFHAYGFIAKIVEFVVGRFVAESTATFGQSYDEVEYVLTEHGLELDSSVSALETVSGIFEQHVFDENGVSKLDSHTINTDPSKGVVHEHAEEIDAAVQATCSSTGLTQGSHCSLCGAVLITQEVVAMLPHTPVIDPAVPATCTQTGLTQGSHCGVCGASITAQLTIQTDTTNGHNWVFDNFEFETSDTFTAINGNQDAPIALAHYHCSLCNSNATAGASVSLFSTTLADCTNDGKKVYHASISKEDSLDLEFHNTDNSGVGEFTIAQLGHDIVHHAAQAATCTAVGWAAYDTCSRCDYSTYQEIPAGHTEVVDAAVAPSCTQTGLTEGKHCSVCNAVIVAQQVVSALEHNWGTPTYEWSGDHRTCTATVSCTRQNCDGKVTEITNATLENNVYTATFTNILFETQTSEATRERLDIDDSITLNYAITDLIMSFVPYDIIDGVYYVKFDIVFNYLDSYDELPGQKLSEEALASGALGESYYEQVEVRYDIDSANKTNTLYFLSNCDIYLSSDDRGSDFNYDDRETDFIFGDLIWFANYANEYVWEEYPDVEFIDFKIGTFDFTNFHIDASSNLNALFAGIPSLGELDLDSIFGDEIILPDDSTERLTFLFDIFGWINPDDNVLTSGYFYRDKSIDPDQNSEYEYSGCQIYYKSWDVITWEEYPDIEEYIEKADILYYCLNYFNKMFNGTYLNGGGRANNSYILPKEKDHSSLEQIASLGTTNSVLVYYNDLWHLGSPTNPSNFFVKVNYTYSVSDGDGYYNRFVVTGFECFKIDGVKTIAEAASEYGCSIIYDFGGSHHIYKYEDSQFDMIK